MTWATLAFEAAMTPALMGFLGYMVDAKLGTTPWILVSGIILGLIGTWILLKKLSERMQNDGNDVPEKK